MTYTKEINEIRYSVDIETVLYFQLESLWKSIESISVNKIKDGFKIEIGFSIFTLKENKNGYTIVAPDYTSSPFLETTVDLTLSFLIQMEQIDVLKKYGIEGEKIRFDDEIVVAKGVLLKSQICLQRFNDLSGSGWCINEVFKSNDKFSNVEPTGYDVIYAYQLLNIRPSILKVLLLPYNYIVVFDGDNIIEILDEDDKSIIDD